MKPDRKEYVALCSARWYGLSLSNARRNFVIWESLHESLRDLAIAFNRDCWAKDLSGKCHNSDGTLTGYCWLMSDAFGGAKGSIGPLLDFEENFQKVFVARGLLFYLQLVLRDLERDGAVELPLLAGEKDKLLPT